MSITSNLVLAGRRRAISLIEGVLYLVIALTVIVGGIVFFQQSQLSNAVTDTARAAVGISSQARALYQNQTGFGDNEDLTLAMIRAGAVPSNFIDNSGDAIAHPFGGGVSVTGNGKGFVISYSDISQAACLRLASIDETGVGPMGTGIVGLTISEGDPVDPTSAPDITGAIKADAMSSSCADGAEMAVYYAQHPGAKFAEAGGGTSGPDPEIFATDNPFGYPHPRRNIYSACQGYPSRSGLQAAWKQCLRDWGRSTYGDDWMRPLDEICGPTPNRSDFDMTVSNANWEYNRVEDTHDECMDAYYMIRFNRRR
ncbi:type 4 pilus major pilin [Sulfitobacter sp. 1A13353]|uniref:type 4 pilus major pilin n=1 Tax=Sulfitobacter sp. 1A13353 TaxID=3368568 RepID=UPI0037475940